MSARCPHDLVTGPDHGYDQSTSDSKVSYIIVGRTDLQAKAANCVHRALLKLSFVVCLVPTILCLGHIDNDVVRHFLKIFSDRPLSLCSSSTSSIIEVDKYLYSFLSPSNDGSF